MNRRSACICFLVFLKASVTLAAQTVSRIAASRAADNMAVVCAHPPPGMVSKTISQRRGMSQNFAKPFDGLFAAFLWP